MAKPIPVSAESLRIASAGLSNERRAESRDAQPNPAHNLITESEDLQDMERLRDENNQLRTLCVELEQALQESTARGGGGENGADGREFEMLIEEKSETIRHLHQQVEELQAALIDAEGRLTEAAEQGGAPKRPAASGPVPREEELLNLSEELERERRQLQEDEQTLMDQMREMEVGMARERAELARQRNDLQRLQADVRHEIERLERNGALQSKIDNLKSKLQDVTARRGAARAENQPGQANPPAASGTPSQPQPAAPAPKGNSLMGRLFGQGGR
jgi:chromosome segregation ATPase